MSGKGWLRVLLATVGGAFAGSVGQWANSTMGGTHVPFTAGTIVAPAVVTIISTLAALFAPQPHKLP